MSRCDPGRTGASADTSSDTSIAFTKMHGLGNDFMVIDNRAGTHDLSSARIRAWADRHTGIGFDQLLVVQAPSRADCEFDYRIHNADGNEVEHCGNGARCFARFVRERHLTDSERIRVNTAGGPIVLRVRNDGQVTVDMGVPTFEPERVPFLADAGPGRGAIPMHRIEVAGESLEAAVTAIGNPHVVLEVADVDRAPVARLGPLLESHARFPARVNVGFLQILAPDAVRLRVFERGVGETRACGTGACAAVATGILRGVLERRVRVALSGGDLQVAWPSIDAPIEMTGPCSTVFEGRTRM